MLAAVLAGAPRALAQDTTPPANLTNHQVTQIAAHDPNVVRERQENGHLVPSPTLKPGGTWEVGFFRGQSELALVMVSDADRRRSPSPGPATRSHGRWPAAIRAPSAARSTRPYVWLPLCAIFFFGLLDYRRLGRVAHLDLLVLLGFGVSQFFFNEGNIGVSVPLAYPVLLYLLARMLWVGFRGRGAGLRPSLGTAMLAVLVVFLVAFRAALNIADSNVIDVGYAGVVGADQVTHGQPIYGVEATPVDNPTATPTVRSTTTRTLRSSSSLPGRVKLGDLPAAHGAAITFDLMTSFGLFFLGPQLPGGPSRHCAWA